MVNVPQPLEEHWPVCLEEAHISYSGLRRHCLVAHLRYLCLMSWLMAQHKGRLPADSNQQICSSTERPAGSPPKSGRLISFLPAIANGKQEIDMDADFGSGQDWLDNNCWGVANRCAQSQHKVPSTSRLHFPPPSSSNYLIT